MLRKTLSLILTLIIVGSFFASCKENENKTSGSSHDTEGLSTSEYKADLPQKDYKGYEFRILQRDHSQGWGEKGFFAESDSSNVFDAAVYKRNGIIENRYNIAIKTIEVVDNNIAGGALYRKAFSSLSTYSDDYDMILPSAYDAITLSNSGQLLDLSEQEYIDLSAPWWAESLNRSIALGGKQYYAVSDAMFNDKLDSAILLFNKELMSESKLEEPYALVKNKEWTLDKFKEYLVGYGGDINSDGVEGYEDKYGAFLFELSGIIVGAGITGASLDEEGIPHINELTPKYETVFDKIFHIVNTPYMVFDMYNYDGPRMETYTEASPNEVIDAIWRKFRDGDTLFCGCAVETISYYLRDMDGYGIIPYPMADESQDQYYNRVGHTGATFITIPYTVVDADRSAIVIEDLSCEAKNIISPAFYDQLIGEISVRDDGSAEMLDIIFSSGVLDLDMIYEWGAFVTRWHTLITQNIYELASTYEGNITPANEKLLNTLKNLGLAE